MKKRVVIAGLGDTGLLVALGLHPEFEVVGISPKPALVSGQELGTRLARPDAWRANYRIAFSRYRKLAGMSTVHGLVTSLEPDRNRLVVRLADGSETTLEYDALVLAMGVTNGFWRSAALEDDAAIERRIDQPAEQLRRARTILVIGAGASGVSAASNLKEAYPDKAVTLSFAQDEILPGYHPKVRAAITARLRAQGVELVPGHRARMPAGFHGERITSDPVEFTDGRAPLQADAVLWAVGKQRPNTDFVPKEMLDDHGFVKADAMLRVPGTSNVFTVGDVAATDPNRSSARNSGFVNVVHNVRCLFAGREERMKPFEASPHRWGSVLGVQSDGMQVFAPNGIGVRIRPFWVEKVLFPLIVRRGIYKGIDPEPHPGRGLEGTNRSR